MDLPLILKGKVVHGKELGRTVGMPTANLQISNQKLPKSGVYATRIKIGDKYYASVTNIGMRPTVDSDKHITVETHILYFNCDIYGEEVVLEILGFLRPVQRFESLQQVQEQVKKDILNASKFLLDSGQAL